MGLPAGAASPSTIAAMENVTFGNGLPGYVCGDVASPAVIVIQARFKKGVRGLLGHNSCCSCLRTLGRGCLL